MTLEIINSSQQLAALAFGLGLVSAQSGLSKGGTTLVNEVEPSPRPARNVIGPLVLRVWGRREILCRGSPERYRTVRN